MGFLEDKQKAKAFDMAKAQQDNNASYQQGAQEGLALEQLRRGMAEREAFAQQARNQIVNDFITGKTDVSSLKGSELFHPKEIEQLMEITKPKFTNPQRQVINNQDADLRGIMSDINGTDIKPASYNLDPEIEKAIQQSNMQQEDVNNSLAGQAYLNQF